MHRLAAGNRTGLPVVRIAYGQRGARSIKLAEALIERKGLKDRITFLEQRIHGCATYQEGAEPTEDANQLLQELDTAYAEFGSLIVRINRVNASAVLTDAGVATATVALPEGVPLTELIVRRDLSIRQQNALQRVAQHVRANLSGTRGMRSELRMVTKVDLNQLESQISKLGASARKLDAQIQGANWTIELI